MKLAKEVSSIATLIRAGRIERGETQGQLADRLKVSPSLVSMWENGRSLPAPHEVPGLARAIGVSKSELAKMIEKATRQ